MILDNVGNPNESSAERYLVDEQGDDGAARPVATRLNLAWSHRLAGAPSRCLEVMPSCRSARPVESRSTTSDGRVVWRIVGNAGYVFRAQRFPSLYAPGVGAAQ